MTAIWNASAVTPLATDRIPVDVSSSGAPSRWTGQNIADINTIIGGTVTALGSINSATALNLALGGYFSATITGNLTFSITNVPASAGVTFVLALTNGGAFTVTLPGSVTIIGGSPVLSAAGTDWLVFRTLDGGTAWTLEVVGNPRDADLATWAGITPGTGVGTALGTNVGSAGSVVVNGGALGTPSSGSLANCTGYPAAGTTLQVQYNNAGAFGGMNLWRESADISAFRNGTTAQTVHAYKTTDAGNVNYERLAFVPGAATGWMQIAAQSGGTGAANYGIALSPKGTGAVSAQVPDSGTGGGIARGSNSVDWQTSRSSSAMVAAGLASVVAGGVNNISSNTYSVVSGGGDNNANGIVSWIPGGYQAITRGLYGAYAYSAGRRSANGDAQVIGQPVRRTTTDATPVSLATDGTPTATTVMVLPANSTLMATAIVVARDSSGNSAGWIAQALFKRDGSSNTSRLGSATVTPIGTPDAAINTATIDLVANDTLESAQIQVTGVAATTIYWVGELKCVQVL